MTSEDTSIIEETTKEQQEEQPQQDNEDTAVQSATLTPVHKWLINVDSTIRKFFKTYKTVLLETLSVILAVCTIVSISMTYSYAQQNEKLTNDNTKQSELIDVYESERDKIKSDKESLEQYKEQLLSRGEKLREKEQKAIEQQQQLDNKQNELNQKEQDLNNRNSQLDERERNIAYREQQKQERIQREQQALLAAQQAPSYSDSTGGYAFYKNCSAARAAGAAPIYRGQPGYRDKLDRDGDGIACEWS